jgi:hypothetical protein
MWTTLAYSVPSTSGHQAEGRKTEQHLQYHRRGYQTGKIKLSEKKPTTFTISVTLYGIQLKDVHDFSSESRVTIYGDYDQNIHANFLVSKANQGFAMQSARQAKLSLCLNPFGRPA